MLSPGRHNVSVKLLLEVGATPSADRVEWGRLEGLSAEAFGCESDRLRAGVARSVVAWGTSVDSLSPVEARIVP